MNPSVLLLLVFVSASEIISAPIHEYLEGCSFGVDDASVEKYRNSPLDIPSGVYGSFIS